MAQRLAKTFFALLELADLDTGKEKKLPEDEPDDPLSSHESTAMPLAAAGVTGLHYNIQIHLPATKDVEVYNAIFKSLRVHLVA